MAFLAFVAAAIAIVMRHYGFPAPAGTYTLTLTLGALSCTLQLAL